MSRLGVLVFSLLLVSTLAPSLAAAASPPDGYVQMSAERKRYFHQYRGGETPYWFYPSSARMMCKQGMAMLGLGSKGYMGKTLNSGSGYASFRGDTWRWLFGKAIHSYGPMAAGEVELKRSILGLPPGKYPVTYRFSLANTYLPHVPFAEFRPGLAIIFHQDGKDDVTLFLMPPNGLDGFKKPQNPFSLSYTNWLSIPGQAMQIAADVTFRRVTSDPYHQHVGVKEGLEVKPVEGWDERYDRTRTSLKFGQRLAAIPANTGYPPEPIFEISDVLGEDGKRIPIGTASIIGGWVNSKHADNWFLQHTGFAPPDDEPERVPSDVPSRNP